jgi:hypothetical protein
VNRDGKRSPSRAADYVTERPKEPDRRAAYRDRAEGLGTNYFSQGSSPMTLKGSLLPVVLTAACLLGGCGGGSSSPAPVVTPPAPKPTAVTGIVTPAQVSVVTAKNAG